MNRSEEKRYEGFTYRTTHDGKVFISHHGKRVTTLSGKAAEGFIADIEELGGSDVQLLMAKVAGTLRRGDDKS